MSRWSLCAIALCATLGSAYAARAQAATSVESTGEVRVPWTVNIRPSARAVAVGNCQLVYIDLTDETAKDSPRRPGGNRVGLADFDWSATGSQPNAAVGIYDGPNSWSVCACQGAAIGSPITITATYPAKSLPEKVRVPGLAFRSTTQIPISAAHGTSNPRGCDAPRAALPAAASVGTVLPPPMVRMTATTPAPAAQPASSPQREAGSQPTGPPPPSGIATPPSPSATPAGPQPSSVSVAGSPAEAVVTWFAPATYNTPAPTGYIVDRILQSDPAVVRGQSPTLTVREWHDNLVSSGTWIYRVRAIYADGRSGSAGASFTYPEPQTPQNVHAEQVGRDTVTIGWQPVPGASYYNVTGPPGMSTVRADSAHITKTGMPLGSGTWQISAVYTGTANPGAPGRSGPAATVSVTVVHRRYRLVAEAMRVTTETADQQFSGDGKYDEVFVIGIGERVNRQTGAKIDVSKPQVSAVHGDVSNWPPPQRVKAGTASGYGGIQHGDVVSPIWSAPTASAPMGTPVFVLWEGELIDGTQDLLLHPMVLEVDEPDYDSARAIPASYAVCNGIPCSWARYFTGPAASSASLPAVKTAMAAPRISVQDGVQMWLTSSGYFVHLENQNRDRPIGLVVEDHAEQNVGLVGMWRDKVVLLSREKIEAALASGQNRIEVRFWDHWNLTNAPQTTINYLNGDYTLVIRIERAP